jgi:cleavage and polyadenylation specificity factor subunit 1
MRPEEIPKTAIVIPFELWEFTLMPFGLKNAGQTFQHLLDRVGADLLIVFIYLDNILVASPDVDSHNAHLHAIIQRLRQYSLVLNLEKCELGCQSVDFLGHRISATGVQQLLKHVIAIHLGPRTCGPGSPSWGWSISTEDSSRPLRGC